MESNQAEGIRWIVRNMRTSGVILLGAGVLLLVSQIFLGDGTLLPWIAAKVLYAAGVILFVINK